MNTITIHGNATRDIEIASKGDVQYAKLTVASDRNAKGDNAATDFFNVVAFGEWTADLADIAKGDWLKIVGSVRLGKHNDRLTVEVVAKQIERKAKEDAA
jgi:single-stranded DNA-binding protein